MSNPNTKEALAKLVATHCVNPLPAYDQNAILIELYLYTRRLDGAAVIIRFNLSHHLICKKGERCRAQENLDKNEWLPWNEM